MTSPRGPAAPEQGGDDPWAAFGYLVAGVLFYGLIGWVLSRWLHADFWIPIGILVGAGFGMYMIFARYSAHDHSVPDQHSVLDKHSVPDEHSGSAQRAAEPGAAGQSPSDDEAARSKRPDLNDRGETA